MVSCGSVDAQQMTSDSGMNSHLVGKITFVQCSAGSAKSTADVSSDVVPGTCSSNSYFYATKGVT